MSGTRELLDDVNRRTDAFVHRLAMPAADATEGTADGRFTLPGLIALLAVGARDRPRQPLVAEAITPATIERALDEIGRLRGVPIRASEVREVIQLLTTGEVIVDVATGLRAALLLVPRLPLALTRDALALPDLPREVAEAIRADLKDDAPRTLRDVIVDLHDGKLDGRRRILTNTLHVLLGRAAPGVLVETIRALIGPENQTLRLAVLVCARTQGIDLDEKDLDALFRALDPAHPDLGVFLDRGLERVTDVYRDASRAVAVLRRISATPAGAVPGWWADGRPAGGRRVSPAARSGRNSRPARPGSCPCAARRASGERPGPSRLMSPCHKEPYMVDRGVRRSRVLLSLCVTLLLAGGGTGCGKDGPRPGAVLDEASRAGRMATSFPAAAEDYFHDMDGGGSLTREEIQGRNTWIVWTGGNDRFWDGITVSSFGLFDLLKIVSSHPDKSMEHLDRSKRWVYLGLVNEPCFDKPTGPDPRRYGLWLDKRRADCPPDPFENEQRYPGVRIGARGGNVPVGSYYGYASGIVGLRLFPNPDFDEAAAKKWDPVRYYTDEKYYNSKDLVRPYRVGMSCAFCHVGPSPTKPPADPENPKWENLASNVGAQYFWVDRIFSWKNDRSNYMYQLLHTSRPGALDTSLVSTDYINNPRTMNAVYQLGPRLQVGKRWGKETLAGGGLNNSQFNDYVKDGPLTEFFQKPDTVWTPRVLKDGSDSVGALGALNRVYLNIGLFSEEWLLHFKPLVGGKPISPIEIGVARKNSVYWLATEAQTPSMALFFLRTAVPHRLKDAPGGAAHLTKDQALLRRGKVAFAERCARCHSSKAPEPAVAVDPGGCAGSGYLACWTRYWEWTKTDEYKQRMRQIVLADNFLEGNYLSNELRVPVTLLETNACSPLATNAIAGNIWDNFSSQSYKDLPSVGTITVHDPFTGQPRPYQMPAGGRGYTRPASLVSVWSTAPFLQNNSVGKFEWSPSVEARMRSFQDSIEKLLWPERRPRDPVLGDKVPGIIDRTTQRSELRVAAGYLPDELQPLLGPLNRHAPWLFGAGGVKIGPIPAGTPVNLMANLELVPDGADLAGRAEHVRKLLPVVHELVRDLKKVGDSASDEDVRRAFAPLAPRLLAMSKCPDFVVDRGHYFGTSAFKEEPGLSDEDKRALIEFLKTF